MERDRYTTQHEDHLRYEEKIRTDTYDTPYKKAIRIINEKFDWMKKMEQKKAENNFVGGKSDFDKFVEKRTKRAHSYLRYRSEREIFYRDSREVANSL